MLSWIDSLNTAVPVINFLSREFSNPMWWMPLQEGTAERWSAIAQTTVGINILLLFGLIYIWGRNYFELRSKHTLGLLVFAILLLARNVWALYIYQFDPVLAAWFNSEAVPKPAWHAMLLLHLFETFALLFLTWVTWD